ncbi:MAG: hypothetical protein H0U70_03305 [Tatlockia sp.]|nr:hypothetical protein [Tatlockia sp.]
MAFAKLKELLEAAQRNNLKKMQLILQENVYEQEDADNALKVAARFGSLDTVRYLIDFVEVSRRAVSSSLITICNLTTINRAVKWAFFCYIRDLKGKSKPSETALHVALCGIVSAEGIENERKLRLNQSTFNLVKFHSQGKLFSQFKGQSYFGSHALPQSMSPGDSCFLPDQLKKIEKQIAILTKEIAWWGCWSWINPHYARKIDKKAGLIALINCSFVKGMTIKSAIEYVESSHKELRVGRFSEIARILDGFLKLETYKEQNEDLASFNWVK